MRGLAQKEVDRHEELELLQRSRDEAVVGQRDFRVETNRQQPADFASIDLAKDLIGVDAGFGNLIRVYAPDFRDISAMLWIAHVARAGKLIALLAVLASTLPVALSGDGRVAAALASNASRSQHDVDRPKHILHSVTVMFDTTCVKQEARFGLSPPLGGLPDCALRNSRYLGRSPGRPLFHVFGDAFESHGLFVYEAVVEPIVFDHQMKDAVEQRYVTARLDRKKQVTRAGDWRDSRIDGDDLCSVFASLPNIVRSDGRALGDIGAADPDDFSFENIGPGVRCAVDAESLLVARGRAHHAE